MITPQQLPSGRWRARIWKPETQGFRSLGTYPTQKAALQAQMKAEAGIFPEPKPEPVRLPGQDRFATYAEDVLWGRRHALAKSTWEAYQGKLRVWINPEFGNLRLCEITSRHIDRWFGNLPDIPSRKMIAVTLRMILEAAVDRGDLDRNPFRVKRYGRKTKKKPPQHWADLRMLCEVAGDVQMVALLWTLAGTGQRIGEALGLDWEDVDLDAKTATVRRHVTRWGIEDGYKHHPDEERVTGMFPEAVDALRALQGTRGAVRTGPVFLHSRGERLSYSSAWWEFKSLRDSLGLTMGFHHLRALHARTIDRFMTPEQVMAQLGHSKYDESLHYIASDLDSRLAVLDRVAGSY